MRFWLSVLFACLLVPQLVFADGNISCAYFTDAAQYMGLSADPPPSDPLYYGSHEGTVSYGVFLSRECGITDTYLNSHNGSIEFWLKPNWYANDNSTRQILRVGSPSTDGILLEKSSKGMLRFVMAGGSKKTAVRADISSWQPNEWHHVMITWLSDRGTNTKPLGIAIWIDKVMVASTIYGGSAFMITPTDKKVYIGSLPCDAVMDELIFKNDFNSDFAQPTVCTDYDVTGPYTAIQINTCPHKVYSEPRVVVGYQKQFGLLGTRTINPAPLTTSTDYLTLFEEVGDARPYIQWTTSDSSIATVDADGRVTGVSAGYCMLTATFRNLTANYEVQVVPANKPDLDVMYVERTPRYSRYAEQTWPANGDTVHSIVHYGNFGFASTGTTFYIKCELIPDLNGNFKIDSNESAQAYVFPLVPVTAPFAPGDTGTAQFDWTWTSVPQIVRVTIDSTGIIDEACEANNSKVESSIAKAVVWGYHPEIFQSDFTNKVINPVGSFSDWDWCGMEVNRLAMLMRDAVLPTRIPNGILDSARLDNFLPWDDALPADQQLYFTQMEYGDGGYEEMWGERKDISNGQIHEMGHNVLRLPDYYGHAISTNNMFLKDDLGVAYAGTQTYPVVSPPANAIGAWSSATYQHPDALGLGYTYLMVDNKLWLDTVSANHAQDNCQNRNPVGDNYGDLVPRGVGKNTLKLYDVNDDPLRNARVYLYQVANDGCPMAWNKYYADRAKFIFTDSNNGLYVIPTTTATTWDDWDTPTVEKDTATALSPFDRTNFVGVSPSWTVGEMMLIKIVSNGQTEFQTLPLTELNKAYYLNGDVPATYEIRTSLTSSTTPPAVYTPTIPLAIRDTNTKPTAKVNGQSAEYQTKTVRKNVNFTLTGSGVDPEGQPLQYRWDGPFGPTKSASMTTKIADPGYYEFKFFVIDGVCYSQMITVGVTVTN